MKNFVKYIIIIFIFALFFYPFGYFVFVYSESYKILKNDDQFKPFLSTKIYDSRGQLISELFDEKRTYIRIDEVPLHVRRAFISAEDKNFYRHRGIDISGILRAIVIDIFSGKIKQGGSTITQQLVKQLYTKREKTFRRKITELLIAMEFERRFDKDKILEMYLNQIYFGHGVYGIASASKFFFNKRADEINIIEASLLASLPSAPNRYSPFVNPYLAYKRNKKIIFDLIYNGYADKDEISRKFKDFWTHYLEKIRTVYPTVGARNIKYDSAPYFTEYIRKRLIKMYGEDKVYRGGLKVYTTLDLRHQKIAREELRQALIKQNKLAWGVNRYRLKNIDLILAKKNAAKKEKSARGILINSKFFGKYREGIIDMLSLCSMLMGVNSINRLNEIQWESIERIRRSSTVEGAFISLDPGTGAITSMIGGYNPESGNFLNRAVQSVRQPGSAFKTFIYGAGFESKKITPASPFNDLPLFFKGNRPDKDWSPSNYGKEYRGRILARMAFAYSLNIVSVLIYQLIGGNTIAKFASKVLNLPEKRFIVDPTLALGTTELSPLEMASGFSVIANNGIRADPFSIRYILSSSGKKIFSREKNLKRRRVISGETAFLLTSLMRGVVDYGTAAGAIRREAGFRLPAAGKTGTNTNYRDAWFVGFTPDLVAAVWIGCDSQKFTLAPGQGGAAAAAPVWGKFMKRIYKFKKRKRFKGKPSGVAAVSICRKTGKIAVKGCPLRREYFIKGTVPDLQCDSDHSDIVSIFGPAKKMRNKLLNKFFKNSDINNGNEDKNMRYNEE